MRLCGALLALACLTAASAAQGHGGGGPGGPGGGPPGGPGGGFGGPPPMGGGPVPTFGNNRPSPPSANGDAHGGLQLGPAGRWWDDAEFAKTLKLDSGQQHRMDAVFNANKTVLINLYKNVQREDKQLSKISRMHNPDEAAIFQQIDRVTQARGELEKAEAHMLLEIRKEMTPQQLAKLEDLLPPE